MSYGITTYDASGGVVFDSSTITARLIYTFDVAAGVSGSIGDGRFAGCIALSVSMLSSVQLASRPHKVIISGTTLTYTAIGNTTPSRILVFAHT